MQYHVKSLQIAYISEIMIDYRRGKPPVEFIFMSNREDFHRPVVSVLRSIFWMPGCFMGNIFSVLL